MDKQILRRKAPQDDTPPEHPPSLTPEQFRRMLDLSRRAVEETLAADPGLFLRAGADPNLARRVLWPLAGTVFPFAGGMPAPCTAGKIPKFDTTGNCSSLTDSVMTELSGNIGIGTTTPGAKLDVLGSIRGTNSSPWSPYTSYYSVGAPDSKWWDWYQDGVTLRLRAINDTYLDGTEAITLTRSSFTVTQVTFPNGKIGIGTDTPAAKLAVAGDTYLLGNGGTSALEIRSAGIPTRRGIVLPADPNGQMIFYVHSFQNNPNFEVRNALDDSLLFRIKPGGFADVNGSNPRFILESSDPNTSRRNLDLYGSGSSARWRLYKEEKGTDTTLEYLTVLSAGNVGIGTTTPQEKLDVAGNILSQGLNKIVFLKPLGGTQDDQPQIQAAINALPAEGGIIYFTPGTYRIGSQVSVAKNGVKLRGYGGAWRDGNLITTPTNQPPYCFTVPVNNTGANPLTKLLWTGATGGTIASVVPAVSNTQIQDLEISDLAIDGAGVKNNPNVGAGIGLFLDRVTNSVFRHVEVRNMKFGGSTGIKLTTTATASSMNTHFNLFDHCAVNLASVGVHLTGARIGPKITWCDGTPNHEVLADTYHNTFIGLTISYWPDNADNKGVWLEDCDGNVFHNTYIFRNDIGSGQNQGRAVVVEDPQYGLNNEFYNLVPVGGLLVKKVNPASLPGFKMVVFSYALDPGLQPAPAAQDAGGNPVNAELVVAWTTESGELHGFGNISTTGGLTVGIGGTQGVNAGSVSVAGVQVIDPSRNIVNVGSITASGGVTTGGGVTVGTGGSQGVNAGSYSVAGTVAIDSSKVIHGNVGGNLIRQFSQSSRPTLNAGEVAWWHRNPGDQFRGLLFFDGNSYYWLASDNAGGGNVQLFGNP